MNYRRIKSDIEAAKIFISPQFNPTNDEYSVDISLFHCQQAIEKILKYYLFDIYGTKRIKL